MTASVLQHDFVGEAVTFQDEPRLERKPGQVLGGEGQNLGQDAGVATPARPVDHALVSISLAWKERLGICACVQYKRAQ